MNQPVAAAPALVTGEAPDGASSSSHVPGGTGLAPAISAEPAAAATQQPSIASAFGGLGPLGILRSALFERGITYNFVYNGEVLGNATGGIKRGATYEGQLDGVLDIDLDKLAGWRGGALHANFYQNHGRGLSGNNTLDLFTVSTLEAYPSTKLYEAWFEQTDADGKLALKIGQIGADVEFFTAEAANVFFDPTFGAPALLANDLPSGGPTYPLAAPAIRLLAKPDDRLTAQVALFDGDPAGPYRPGLNSPLPQVRDLSGTNFRIEDPPLLIAEAAMVYHVAGLGPATLKVGLFQHFGQFAAVAEAVPGILLKGDGGVYALVDQTLYTVPGDPNRGISAFLRAFAAPSDRNLIDRYIDGGISFKGLSAARPKDTLGLAFAYARISPEVTALDIATKSPLVRDYQVGVEATYQLAVRDGLTIQPDFQYLVHPGAHGVANPATGRPIGDSAVFGLRSTISY